MAWVIALKTKYHQDLFFRTECNVIAFQILCTAALLVIVSATFNYLYENITDTLILSISRAALHSKTLSEKEILESLSSIKTRDFGIIFLFTAFVTTIFGYSVAHVTFAPARNALASQKRFISNIAHELRTPLAIIKTNSEVALLSSVLHTDTRRMIKSNIEELDRIADIINNLLSLNNFTKNQEISFTQIDLGVVVENAHKKLRKLAKGKQLEITIRKKGPFCVWGNTIALEQIVTNLLRNAIAYTAPLGRIVVSVEPDYQGNILLTVADTGMGISQNDLFHIFEPFYRAERSRNRESGSSGLGLTIVSELVKIHSGSISVKSAPNRGTVVTVILPYSKPTTGAVITPPSSHEISMDFPQKN